MSRRFALYSLFALGLGVVLFVVGWSASAALVEAAVGGSSASDATVHTTGPRGPARHSAGIAAAFALPALVAWTLVLVHRIRVGADPSPLAGAAYFAVPALGAAAGLLGRVMLIRSVLRTAQGQQMRPTLMLEDLSFGLWGIALCLAAGAGMALIVVFTRA